MNNIGLYVKVFGRVKQIDPESTRAWFVIDDGSGVFLKVLRQEPVPVPGQEMYVIVRGISSCEAPTLPDEKPTRVVRAVALEPVPEVGPDAAK